MKLDTLARKGFLLPKGQRFTASGMYDAAAGGRRLGGYQPSAFGPNPDATSSLRTIRSRSRDMVRNNPFIANAMETYTANLVGSGIIPRWNLKDDPDLRDEIHQLFEDWAQEADSEGKYDFYGLQGLIARTVWQSGECLVRLRPRRLSDGLSVPFQLQVLEPDFLDEMKDGPAEIKGNTIFQGIEFDHLGRRVAYWIHPQHPGDSLLGVNQSKRVPASEILHIYRVDRPGQLRGLPRISPALVRAHMLDQYEDAELDRKKTAALFAAFIKTNAPGDLGTGFGFGAESNTDDNNNPFAVLEPGILQYLLPGEDVTFSQPADVGASYEAFLRQQQRAIAAGIGLTYEQLTGDLSGVNFSSIRAGLLEFRRKTRMEQQQLMVFQFCQKVAKRWMALAVASGALDIPDFGKRPRDYTRIQWRAPGWDWVDPVKEITAARLAIAAGLDSRERIVAERLQVDIEELDAQIAADVQRQNELGIVFDPNLTAAEAQAIASIIEPEEPEPGEKPDDEEEDVANG